MWVASQVLAGCPSCLARSLGGIFFVPLPSGRPGVLRHSAPGLRALARGRGGNN